MKKKIPRARFLSILWRAVFLFFLLAAGGIVYDYYTFEERYARDVLSYPASEHIDVVKVVRKGLSGGGYAVMLCRWTAEDFSSCIRLRVKHT